VGTSGRQIASDPRELRVENASNFWRSALSILQVTIFTKETGRERVKILEVLGGSDGQLTMQLFFDQI
jgi:hypothetical protein